jgi:hypothetical protein
MMIIVKCVEEDSEAQLEKNRPAQSMNYDHPCIFTGMSTSVAGRTQRGAKTFVARQSRPHSDGPASDREQSARLPAALDQTPRREVEKTIPRASKQ